MSATDPSESQTARRSVLYGCAVDTEPCEGRHAFPSNPHWRGQNPRQRIAERDIRHTLHCIREGPVTRQGRSRWLACFNVAARGVRLTEARRRKQVPRTDSSRALPLIIWFSNCPANGECPGAFRQSYRLRHTGCFRCSPKRDRFSFA